MRFAEYIAKVPPKPATTNPPAASSVASVSEPDYGYDPAVGPPKAMQHLMDLEGNCYPQMDTDTPRVPKYATATPDYTTFGNMEKILNNAVITITCQPPFVLQGSGSISCVSGDWVGSFGQCVCPRYPGWCGLTASENVYTQVDCDHDGLLDHVCEDYSVGTGLTRYTITSSSQCVSNSQATVKDCPAAFGVFPYTAIGQCFGLRYDPATSCHDCSKSCASQPLATSSTSGCSTWQWSNIVNQCWLGKADHCGGGDIQWIGATKVCNRPLGWCNYSYFGDQYLNVDCDGDGIKDHACVNGNTGGRIASGTQCADNWPNANNDDCHAAFD